MLKNTAGQKWRVFAFNRTTNVPVIGDAANITAKVSIDYGSRFALADTNPTEAEDGFYYFDLTSTETNGSILELFPESSTSGVQIVGVPARELTFEPASSSGGSSGGSSSRGTVFTQDEIEENLSKYCDYDVVGSVDRAKSLVVWARRWLIQFPANREDQYNVLTYSPVEVRKLLEAAQSYVSQNEQATSNTNSRVRFFSFENFRN